MVSRRLSLDDANFEEALRIEAAASEVTGRAAHFRGRSELSIRWAEIDLTGASFSSRSRVSGADPFSEIDELPAQACRLDRKLDAQAQPRLLSLRRADVPYLALNNLDLRACQFHGTHGLDEIRLEASCLFPSTPAGPRYTTRLTLAEEHQLRAGLPGGGRAAGWLPDYCRPPDHLNSENEQQPGEITEAYRALRKALEDRGNAPGAGDFYYGEMEMRRLSRPRWGPDPARTRLGRGLGERMVVTFYWLTSGYGLRASRAFALLALVISVGATLLYLKGFETHHSPGRALFAAFESAISLLRVPRLDLTPVGEVTQAALRVLGPLLAGLGLLALRGRVKRQT